VKRLSPYREMIESIAARYADPGFAPEWSGVDKPRWETNTPEQRATFKAYVNRQLDELEERVRADRVKQLEEEVTPEMLAEFGAAVVNNIKLAQVRIADFKALHPGKTVNDYIKLERRMQEQQQTGTIRRGPTKADPGEQARHPSALAAIDVRRMRDVIFPRFWGHKNRTVKPTAEEIAAERHGIRPSAVKSRINKSN
jgi:hypothetical protein